MGRNFNRLSISNMSPDLLFLNIHDRLSNNRKSVYLDKHYQMSLDKVFFVQQISNMDLVTEAHALCQLYTCLLHTDYFVLVTILTLMAI